jgi:predicted phosphoribosyltransferase
MSDDGISFEPEVLFHDRTEAGRRLAGAFEGRMLRNPLVLAIPRGGVETGLALARALGAEIDVILSRKLRAPAQPELAIGAIAENGEIYLNPDLESYVRDLHDYLGRESRRQLAEIRRRRRLLSGDRPPLPVEGRSVIVTDDGIATGSTMIAALQSLRNRRPHEVIVAVPVASPARLREVRRWCDEIVCLAAPEEFTSVGQFYEDFSQVEDGEVVRMLSENLRSTAARQPETA